MRWPRRLPKLPVLTPAEKTALIVLILVLGSGLALRIWEHSGVRIGPVRDWDTLHAWVTQARRDAGDDTLFPCFQGEGNWPQRRPDSSTGGPKSGHSHSRLKKMPPTAPIDINLAGAAALEKLPKVGPSTARAIVSYRAVHGKFGSAEGLLEVKGIGPKKFAALKPFIRVGTDMQKTRGP